MFETARSAGATRRLVSMGAGTIVFFMLLTLLAYGSASGATAAGTLKLHTMMTPSRFSEQDNELCLSELKSKRLPACDVIQVTVTNTGSVQAEGPITILDEVPAGLEIHLVQLFWSGKQGTELNSFCSFEEEPEAVPLKCQFPIGLEPDQTLEVLIYVTVEPGAETGQLNKASVVSGSGVTEDVVNTNDVIDANAPSFGPSDLESDVFGLDGHADTQAGDHPYSFTTRFDLSSAIQSSATGQVQSTSVRDVKDVVVDLPLGFVGGATATPKCTLAQLASLVGCPSDTTVGHLLTEPESLASVNSPIFNLVPESGVAAEFGFTDVLNNTHVIYASVAPTPSGYVLRATSPDVPQTPLTDVVATFYGNPAARDESGITPVAAFTNPSQCTGKPLVTSMYMDSWQAPGRKNAAGGPDLSDPNWAQTTDESPPVVGCNQLRFSPSAFSFRPETGVTNSPTGLTFRLAVPQAEQPNTLGTPPLKDATVTLPQGMIVNPAAAGGLTGCSPAQIGWLGETVNNFTPTPPSCPDPSKVGSVEVVTPLLPNPVVGSVYLATQNENPFHSLLAGYIVIDDPATGLIVKIAGRLSLDEKTGQITGVFDENPQLPFSELKLRFFGGARGELATPESCGTYTTTGTLTPWSAPQSGPPASVADSFAVDAGCTPGFAPSFAAGSTNPQAGGFSSFVLSFARQDSDEELSGLTLTLPPGLLAKLAGVSECSDAALAAVAANPSGAAEQANPGCPSNSRLGTVQAAAGVGPDPLVIGGKAYLTGPYGGGPYGIAVVVPAIAGPFDLGNVVVRSSLHIDPSDAHVTVVSDPLPAIVDAKGADGRIDGFPVRLRGIDVFVDRASFTLNPTNCNVTAISGALTSPSGRVAALSSRFAVNGCRELQFKPKFAASTSGKDSKPRGAAFHVSVASHIGQANIAKVKVALPKQLPSRLGTLQQACLASTFAANPAACPAGSLVGSATAVTPLLSKPLAGPAYIVSYGGAKFPDLEIVLQGEGITLVLDGNTDIKNGITTSTFNAVPDAPVTTFNLDLPQGPHSILGTNLPIRAKYNMCGQRLNMPTTITAQNGAVLRQTTKVSITGCKKHKAKKAKRAKKSHGSHRSRRKR